MKKIVRFVYNPHSGERTILGHLDDIISRYQKKGFVIMPYQLTFEAAPEGMLEGVDDEHFHHVLIAGGDGTVNAVVNEMKRKGLDVPIAVLPTGTANDFAKLFGMPGRIPEAVDAILKGDIRRVDIGKVNDRYFINVLSCGLFTDVSQKTPTVMKNTFGKLAYYFSSMQELPNFKKIHLDIESKEVVFNDSCLVFFVFNGRTAGNMRFAYLSDAQDGLLDVLILKGDNVVDTIRMVFHFLGGAGRDYPKGVVHFKTRRLKVTSEESVSIDIDGEGGVTTPVEIACVEGGIQVVCPRGMRVRRKNLSLF